MTKKKVTDEKVGLVQPEPDQIEPYEEPYKPMAAPEPTPMERLEALEIQMKVMKDWINKHNRQHYGRDAV
jgi:hypothetical protein